MIKAALQVNAAAVIFVHNHPSGCADPSFADRALTQALNDALRYVDVTVKRWQAPTGKQATLATTGETFAAASARLANGDTCDETAVA